MWAKMGPEGRATAGAATWSHFRVCCCDFNAALALTRHCRTGQIQKYLFLFMVHAVVLFILPRTTTTEQQQQQHQQQRQQKQKPARSLPSSTENGKRSEYLYLLTGALLTPGHIQTTTPF